MGSNSQAAVPFFSPSRIKYQLKSPHRAHFISLNMHGWNHQTLFCFEKTLIDSLRVGRSTLEPPLPSDRAAAHSLRGCKMNGDASAQRVKGHFSGSH